MNDIAFCCVSFGERYNWRQGRLKESILSIYPEANLFFWTDSYPPGSKPFNESLYGFKPHAIEYARRSGFKKIVWIDATMILMDKLDYYETVVKEYGVLAIQDDNKLTNLCSDRAMKFMGMNSRQQLESKNLVGGSFYYFDFNVELCQKVFQKWMHAENEGIFGSQSEEATPPGLQGHRHDETMMALSLYLYGSKPFTGDTRYNCDGGITRKAHFK